MNTIAILLSIIILDQVIEIFQNHNLKRYIMTDAEKLTHVQADIVAIKSDSQIWADSLQSISDHAKSGNPLTDDMVNDLDNAVAGLNAIAAKPVDTTPVDTISTDETAA
jgi:hypothetical protein